MTELWQERGAAEEDGLDLNKWARAAVDIVTNNTNNNYKLIWEATVGDKHLGNIAIDDVTFTPGCV